MKEKVEFRKIREFSEIIGDTILFIKQNFKPLMKAFFAICGLFIVGGILSMIMLKIQVTATTQAQYGQGGAWYTSTRSLIFTWEYLLTVIFSMLNYTAMYVTVLSFVALYIRKGNVAPNLEEIWSYFKFYFFRMLGSTILMSIFLGLCIICCLLPGIYVFPAVILFYPIMVLENASFSYSFERSFKLLKDQWWITAATIFIIYLIYIACNSIVRIPEFIVEIVSALTQGEGAVKKGYSIVAAISMNVAQVFMVIPIIASALIYSNLVERRESSGLLSRIDELGQNTNQDNAIPEEY